MAEKLIKYYKYIFEQKGYVGKVELAMLTKTPAVIAATESDSVENIEKFKEAVKKITDKPAPEY